ncbi:MAG TPA: ATP-dependent Clp protease adaptor ClpS [Polyangiaceae bacterium]|nr:ATP-dependent Clp protease adaptor ClpS [Polyangiaceae bacterium]
MRKRDADGVTVLERAPKITRARKWAVVFYNDDYTTKWFVVEVLQQFFHMSETSATALMMAIHEKGKGIAGIFSRDIAETKADQVMRLARELEMPLLVTAEPDEDGDEGESGGLRQ